LISPSRKLICRNFYNGRSREMDSHNHITRSLGPTR
jgi:hypothetical protein